MAVLTELLSTAKPESIPVLSIMGGTATGKTDTAALLSEQFPAELISVDSSLVYRGMNIGTAKPDPEFLEKYPHHLVDIRNPDETYSVADFCEDAVNLIEDITSRGKVPILVGGTSFYFAGLEKGLPNLPNANPEVRKKIDNEAAQTSWQAMHDKLANLDAKSAARIKPSDPQRIQRALEIIEITGEPVADLTLSESPLKNPLIKTALVHPNRKFLHKRIEQRFDIMMEQGLLKEIKELTSQYPKEISAFRMIGYRQLIEGIDSGESLDSMIEKSIIATRKLAKRQLTWLRNQSNVLWFALNGLETSEVSHILANYYGDWAQYLIKPKD